MTQDETYEKSPPETDALWAQLYQEAQTRYDDLAPQVSRRFGVIVVVVGIGLLIAGWWAANQFYFQPH